MEITIQEAYDEACKALGEALVRERLLTKALVKAQEPPAPEAVPVKAP